MGKRAFLDNPETSRPCYVGNSLATLCDEVIDGYASAWIIVRKQGHRIGRAGRQRINYWNGEMREIDRQLLVDPFSCSDDAVDLLVKHCIDVDFCEIRVVLHS